MPESISELGIRLRDGLDDKGLLSNDCLSEDKHTFSIIMPASLVSALNIDLCIRPDQTAVLTCTILEHVDQKRRAKVLEALNTLNGITYFLKYVLTPENTIVSELSFYLPDDCDQAYQQCLKVLDTFSALTEGAILLILKVALAKPSQSDSDRLSEYLSGFSPSKMH